MSQAGNIPIRIENLPFHLHAAEKASMDNILTVREGDPIELPCVGIGLPPPIYRYVQIIAAINLVNYGIYLLYSFYSTLA